MVSARPTNRGGRNRTVVSASSHHDAGVRRAHDADTIRKRVTLGARSAAAMKRFAASSSTALVRSRAPLPPAPADQTTQSTPAMSASAVASVASSMLSVRGETSGEMAAMSAACAGSRMTLVMVWPRAASSLVRMRATLPWPPRMRACTILICELVVGWVLVISELVGVS